MPVGESKMRRLRWAGLRAPKASSAWFGFTLIELMVVIAVIAILASLVTPRFIDRVEAAREVQLRQNLIGIRTAIDHFYRDQSRYPNSLAELVEKRYLRAVPQDPVTQRADTWTTVASADAQGSDQAFINASAMGSTSNQSQGGGGIFDIHSGARGNSRDGTAYAQW